MKWTRPSERIISYCKRRTREGLGTRLGGTPVFNSRLGPVIEKAKKLSTLQYPRSISVTSAILISKVQPCHTSSGGGMPVPFYHMNDINVYLGGGRIPDWKNKLEGFSCSVCLKFSRSQGLEL